MRKEEMGILDYIRRLGNRSSLIASVALAVFVAVAAATFLMKPVYKAVAEIYIDPAAGPQLGQYQAQSAAEGNVYLQTQLSILLSDAVASKVVYEMGLDKAGEEKKGVMSTMAGMARTVWPYMKTDAKPAGSDREEAIRQFKRDLKTDYAPTSNVVTVSYESSDPEVAARAVNTAVDSMMATNLEMKTAPAKEGMAWLDARLRELRAVMGQSTDQLQEYKLSKGLIVTGDRQANISLQGLADLNSKVLEAESRRYAAEVKYQQVVRLSKDPDLLMSYPAMIENKTIQNLKTEEGLLAKSIAEGSRKYGDRHPQMVRLENEMGAVRKQMSHEADLVVASVKADYEQALRTEQALKRALAGQKSEAMSYEMRSAEYAMKEQDLEGARRTYDEILKKFQESNIIGSIGISPVQYLHRAVPPSKPDRPRKAAYLTFGALLALMCGVGFAVAAEYMDETCNSPEIVEAELGMTVLGVVPRDRSILPGRGGGTLALPAPASVFAESFRNIKGNILLRSDDNPQVIQVGSAVSGEGKSVVALNLACSLAFAGESVVVVDADLRRPSLHRYLKLSKGQGLSGILEGRANVDGSTLRTDVPNLTFIPAGRPASGSGELINSPAMLGLINELRGSYDRVVIDCPPCLGPVDSYILTRMVDGVVVVVHSGKTGKETVAKMMRDLKDIKANVLGCVLNDVDAKSHSYYQYGYDYNGDIAA